MTRHTETYWAGKHRRDPGALPVHDYVRMAEPHLVVLSKLSLRWMLFTLFVAGLCCGMLVGKVLS